MASRKPEPVVVGLIFPEREKILVIRRSVPPSVGEWALPGGYVDPSEDWRKALQREVREEAQLHISVDPKHMRIYDVHSTPDGSKILIFAVVGPEGVKKVFKFKKNNEVSERNFAPIHHYGAPRLCFPLHQQVVERYRGENFDHASAHPGGW